MDIQITHIKFSGDEQGAQTLLKSLGEIFMRGGNAPSLPAAEPMEALPEPNDAIKESTAPAMARIREEKRAPRKAGQGHTPTMFLCQEKPGERFTKEQIAAIADRKASSVYATMRDAEANGKEWGTIGVFHVKRAPAAAA